MPLWRQIGLFRYIGRVRDSCGHLPTLGTIVGTVLIPTINLVLHTVCLGSTNNWGLGKLFYPINWPKRAIWPSTGIKNVMMYRSMPNFWFCQDFWSETAFPKFTHFTFVSTKLANKRAMKLGDLISRRKIFKAFAPKINCASASETNALGKTTPNSNSSFFVKKKIKLHSLVLTKSRGLPLGQRCYTTYGVNYYIYLYLLRFLDPDAHLRAAFFF